MGAQIETYTPHESVPLKLDEDGEYDLLASSFSVHPVTSSMKYWVIGVSFSLSIALNLILSINHFSRQSLVPKDTLPITRFGMRSTNACYDLILNAEQRALHATYLRSSTHLLYSVWEVRMKQSEVSCGSISIQVQEKLAWIISGRHNEAFQSRPHFSGTMTEASIF